jgi:predicted nucleic acid-binding protein
LERGVIRIALDVQEEQADLRALMHRYRNRPMSLADACLVRLSELHATAEVFTLDSDFRILPPAREQSDPTFNTRLS